MTSRAVWHSRPLFVTSTFHDLHAERDHLHDGVFPALEERLRARFHHLEPIDLRLGVDGTKRDDQARLTAGPRDEVAYETLVLKVCLGEVKRSRPFFLGIERCRSYFIGLLGEHYGWIPETIPEDLADAEPWLRVHRHDSVTAVEILHGLLRNPAIADRAPFYFRDAAYLDCLPTGTDRADFASESAGAQHEVAALKDQIRVAHAAVCSTARCHDPTSANGYEARS